MTRTPTRLSVALLAAVTVAAVAIATHESTPGPVLDDSVAPRRVRLAEGALAELAATSAPRREVETVLEVEPPARPTPTPNAALLIARVRDTSGHPAERALWTVHRRSAGRACDERTVLADGTVRTSVPSGEALRVVVGGGGFGHVERLVAPLQPGEMRDLGEIVVGRGYSLHGVVRSASGTGVEDASVELVAWRSLFALLFYLHDPVFRDTRVLATVTTAADGSFRVDGLTAGTYGLAALSPDGLGSRIEWARVPSETADPVVLCTDTRVAQHAPGEAGPDDAAEPSPAGGASLRIELVDPAGVPVPLERVTVSPPSGAERELLTDSFGIAVTAGLAPGPYVIEASGVAAGVTVDAARVCHATLRLDRMVARVRVLRGGDPAPGVLVGIVSGPQELLWAWLHPSVERRSDAKGEVVLVAPRQGDHYVFASAGTDTPPTVRALLLPEDAASGLVELELGGGEVRGWVVGSSSGPIGRAKVSLRPLEVAGARECTTSARAKDDPGAEPVRVGLGEATTLATADGSFRFPDVPPGEYVLLARAPDCEPLRSEPFDVSPDQSVEFGELRLDEHGTVRGRIAEAGGRVLQLRRGGAPVRATTLAEDGSFEFTRIDHGVYELFVDAPLIEFRVSTSMVDLGSIEPANEREPTCD